jgi:hypothetical protein
MAAAGFIRDELTAAQADAQTISLYWEIIKASPRHNVTFRGIL